MNRKKTLEDELFYIGLIFLAAGSVALALYYFVLRRHLPAIPCFFSTALGIYCPGCGGTRAAAALMCGRLLKSFRYHPLVPYSVIIGGGFMITQGLHRLGVKFIKGWKYHNWYLYGAVFLVVANFIVKNLLRIVWNIELF